MKKTPEIFSRIKEFGPDWKARRINIFENLNSHISVVRELNSVIETLTVDDAEELVKQKLSAVLDKTRNRYKSEILESVAVVQDIEKKQKTLIEKADSEENRTEEFESQFQELQQEREKILEDREVRFLYNLEAVVSDLIRKNQLVRRYKLYPQTIFQDLKEFLPETSSKKDFRPKEIIYGPFTVNIILDSETFSDLVDNSGILGVHKVGTPFNLIRDLSNLPFYKIYERLFGYTVEETIRHENFHALVDGAIEFTGRITLLKQLDFVERCTIPCIVAEVKERILRTTPDVLLDRLHNEMLAALRSPEAENLFKEIELPAPLFIKSEQQKNEMIKVLSTAGYEVQQLLSGLKKYASQGSFEDLKEFAEWIQKRFSSLFWRSIDNYAYSFNIAKRIDPEAYDDFIILSYLLKPSQFHHLPKFLEYKYGRESVEKARNSAILNRQVNFFAPESLAVLMAYLEEKPDALSDYDKKNWRIEFLDELEVVKNNFDSLKINHLDQLKNYQATIKKFAQVLGIFDSEIEVELNSFIYLFFAFNIIGPNWRDKPQNIIHFSNLLSEDELQIFKKCVLNEFNHSILYAIDEELPEGLNIRNLTIIKIHPFWEVIKSLNLEKRAEKICLEFIKKW